MADVRVQSPHAFDVKENRTDENNVTRAETVHVAAGLSLIPAWVAEHWYFTANGAVKIDADDAKARDKPTRAQKTAAAKDVKTTTDNLAVARAASEAAPDDAEKKAAVQAAEANLKLATDTLAAMDAAPD